MPIQQDLRAARNSDFAPSLYTGYSGAPLPLSGASIQMEVRLYPGASVALAVSTTINMVDAATPTPADPNARTITLYPVIPKGTLAAMPGLAASEIAALAVQANLPVPDGPLPSDEQTYAYEIMLIYSDASRDSLWIGNFILEPGVVA